MPLESNARVSVRRPIQATILALVVVSIGTSCAKNPVTGRPQAVVVSEKGEIKQGAEAAKMVAEQIGLVSDSALAEYVDEIGQRLVKQSPRSELPHEFHVVEMKEPNAFALPGGYVYVSRGLLAILNSEDELATVIGHEIGHVAARHSVARQTASAPLIPLRIAAGLGGMAASIVSPQIGAMIAATGQLPGALALAKYSRDQEREADELGQRFAAEAGWDPAALSTCMHTLGREEELADPDAERSSFFASHPSSPERSNAAIEFAEGLPRADAGPIAADQAAFLRKLDGLVVGESAVGGVFVEQHFFQPEMDFGIDFPEDWELVNTAAAVYAKHPEEPLLIVLRVAPAGTDPMSAATAFSRETALTEPTAKIDINGLEAVEGYVDLRSLGSRTRAYVLWVQLGDIVFQISGASPGSHWNASKILFEASARSFRKLSEEERAQVRESRIRLVEARESETAVALVERQESPWSPPQLEVANGLPFDEALPTDRLIKVAKEERYVTSGHVASE